MTDAPGKEALAEGKDCETETGRRGHPLWEEPAGFTASRILDEGYGEMTDLRPVGAGPGFNNGWPRLPDGPGYPMASVTHLHRVARCFHELFFPRCL